MYSETIVQFPKLTEALDLCQVPSCVKDAEHLLQEDCKLKETLANRLSEVVLVNDGFLETMKHQQSGATMEVALNTKEHIKMMSSLKAMLQELRAKQRQLDSFWLNHKACLDHMIRVCHFDDSAEKVKYIVLH